MKLWDVAPANELLRGREPNEAYLAASPGRAYALYFTDGGAVELDLRDQTGTYEIRWIDVGTGDWGGRGKLAAGGWTRIAAPGSGHWAAAVIPADIAREKTVE